MKHFVQGENRHQSMLFPGTLDDLDYRRQSENKDPQYSNIQEGC